MSRNRTGAGAPFLVSLCLALTAQAAQPSPGMLRQLFEQELDRCKAQFGESDTRTAQAARDLGLFLHKQGDLQGARTALTQAVRLAEKATGPAARETLASVAELAALTEPRDAELLWQRASLSTDAAVASRSLAALAELRRQAGDPVGAAKLYRQALVKEESASGRESARVAARLNALSLLVDPVEGIGLLERALRITTARLGTRRLETASIQTNLAGLLLAEGRAGRAALLAQQAASTFEDLLGPAHPRTADSYLVRGHALRATGDKSGAERMFRLALAIEEKALGPRHSQTLVDARRLVDFLREIGEQRKAEEVAKRFSAEP